MTPVRRDALAEEQRRFLRLFAFTTLVVLMLVAGGLLITHQGSWASMLVLLSTLGVALAVAFVWSVRFDRKVREQQQRRQRYDHH